MRTSIQGALRAALRAQPDGLTVEALAEPLGMNPNSTRQVLENMPDTYIDRWVQVGRGYAAVWMAMVPPENCPHPVKKEKLNRRLTFC